MVDPDVRSDSYIKFAVYEKRLDLYGSRLDQTWSLVDCSSFVLMEERGIQDALAYDVDFVQAGFNALLRA